MAEEVKSKVVEVLCPKCEIPGHKEEDCDIPDNLFTLNSTLSKAKDPCDYCQRTDHKTESCLQKYKHALKFEADQRKDAEKCFKCGEKGHWFKNCTKADEALARDLTGEKIKCFKCGEFGHE